MQQLLIRPEALGDSVGTLVLGRSSGPVTRNSDNATDTVAAALATILLPANFLRSDSLVRIHSIWSGTLSATTKSVACGFAGTGIGTVIFTSPTQTVSAYHEIWNNNSFTQQQFIDTASALAGASNTAMATNTINIDTTVDQNITLQCAFGANVLTHSITLHQWAIEVVL